MTTATRVGYQAHNYFKNVSLTDSLVLNLGTGNDLTLNHNGTNGFIKCLTGDLLIDNTFATGSTIMRLGTDTAATSFVVLSNGSFSMFSVNGLGLITVPNTSTLFKNGSAGVKQLTYNADGGTDTLTAAEVLDGYFYNGASGGAVNLVMPAATDMRDELLARGITSAAGMRCGEIYVNETGGAATLTITGGAGTTIDGTSVAFQGQCGMVTYVMTGAATATAFVEKDT